MIRFRKLKSLRTRAGLSQNQLARMSGVHRDTISKAENGGEIRTEKASEILDALNDSYYGEQKGGSLEPSTVFDYVENDDLKGDASSSAKPNDAPQSSSILGDEEEDSEPAKIPDKKNG